MGCKALGWGADTRGGGMEMGSEEKFGEKICGLDLFELWAFSVSTEFRSSSILTFPSVALG